MTMREVVAKLIAEGHEVEFYVRKDGGILVKRIDSKLYPHGASGNARAREIAGATISEARVSQLKYATKARKVKKLPPSDPIRQAYEKAKKQWNKAFKSKKGKPHPAGYFPWQKVQYTLEHEGEAEALRRIKEAERYATGIAYSKNVEILAGFIRSAAEQYNSSALRQLAENLIENAYLIKDEWIKPAYDELYKLNAGIPPEEIARSTRNILRL